MKKVLFICEGNVGRSQMAEGFWKNLFGKKSALSAGIDNVGAKYNYKPREDIISAMKERGIDISKQKIKQLSMEMLNNNLTVIVLCNPKLLPSFVESNYSEIIIHEISDPYESTIDGVRSIRNQIEIFINNLAL